MPKLRQNGLIIPSVISNPSTLTSLSNVDI